MNSRRKGKISERHVERLVKEAGIPCDRPLDGRHQEAGDILTRTYPCVAMEVRCRKALSIHRWSVDHEALVGEGDTIPAVVWRTDGDTRWRASLPLADLLWLLELAGLEETAVAA